jgi:hypothetical protein
MSKDLAAITSMWSPFSLADTWVRLLPNTAKLFIQMLAMGKRPSAPIRNEAFTGGSYCVG